MTSVAAPAADALDDLDWVVAGFAKSVPGVLHALAVTADGLPLAATGGLDDAARRHLCAITSGVAGLTRGLSDLLGQAACKHVLVEMDRGLLVVAAISDGSALAVLASPKADVGHVGYEVQMLVKRLGQVLTPAMRVPGTNP